VFVPDDLVLGEVGHGWEQTGSELSYERSGPERWLSTYAVLESLLSSGPGLSETGVEVVGSLVARYWGIRNLSLCVARMIDRGQAPAVHAALVKDMGTRFEQEVLVRIQQIVSVQPSLDSTSLFERLLARGILTAPAFTIRGGTTEILRSVASKGLRP
jgi:hypothetical protein